MEFINTYNISALYSGKVPDSKGWYIFTLAFLSPSQCSTISFAFHKNIDAPFTVTEEHKFE